MMMTPLQKDNQEISAICSQIQAKTVELVQTMLRFDSKQRSFIEFELLLCSELNKIGATMIESIIPLLYGNGYCGPKVNIDNETSYSCVHQRRERGLHTVFGKIKLTRAVYTEFHSGGLKSFLDEKLDIENKRYCPLTKYWSTLMGTIAPFDEAGDILNKIRGIDLSTKQIELSTEEIAKQITEYQESQVQDVVLDKDGKVPAVNIHLNQNAQRTVYLETDGCHVNTHNGWKECKTFMLFETEKTSETEYRLKNKFYFSTMTDVGELKRQMKHHIERYCGTDEVRIVCIGDGAKWIWNACKELFPKEQYPSGIIEIVDFYHALEKVTTLKEEIFNDEESGNKFFEQIKEYLKEGNIETVEQVLQDLKNKQKTQEKREIIDDKMSYFIDNKNRMRYASFKNKNLCIGSGAIESANKYVVQRRVKLQGMIWKEENLNYMVHLRAEYINGQIDKHYGIHNNPLLAGVT